MKTFLIIATTAVVTWVAASVVHGLRSNSERLWMISAIKAPGRMALTEIQADLRAGRNTLAKSKLDALAAAWQRFDAGPDSCTGVGIGDI